MTKNPSPALATPTSKNPETEQSFTVTVLAFENGLQAPPGLRKYAGVKIWKVTDDNTLIVSGDRWQYICPPGMWQSAYVEGS